MKALTVRQPWAGAIFELGKDVENRSWTTPYRGTILIHAGAVLWGTGKTIKNLREEPSWSVGAIIGAVELVDVVKSFHSPWAQSDCWNWVFADATVFDKSIPAKGAMGLWETSTELTKSVCDLL